MNRHTALGCSLIAISLLCAVLASAQGVYVESTRSGASDVIEKVYYMPKMFKSVSGDGSEISILRFDRETVYRLNPEKKTYTAMTFAEIKAMVDMAKSMSDTMMARRIASLPPEKQEKAKEMMETMKSRAFGSGSSREVVPTGEHQTINGFACDKYIVKTNGKESETVWASKQVAGYEAMKRDMEGFLERMSGMLGRKVPLGAWFSQIDGFPIQTESHGTVHTVAKIDHRSIPVSEFEVPEGYTKVSSRM
ncbi:MAG TPA: DUF4412 domain-containing protein, partial [Bacteroidota bacterium]|nr:DUF4412 domain-containing protein [Bacteroidota bacterium]